MEPWEYFGRLVLSAAATGVLVAIVAVGATLAGFISLTVGHVLLYCLGAMVVTAFVHDQLYDLVFEEETASAVIDELKSAQQEPGKLQKFEAEGRKLLASMKAAGVLTREGRPEWLEIMVDAAHKAGVPGDWDPFSFA